MYLRAFWIYFFLLFNLRNWTLFCIPSMSFPLSRFHGMNIKLWIQICKHFKYHLSFCELLETELELRLSFFLYILLLCCVMLWSIYIVFKSCLLSVRGNSERMQVCCSCSLIKFFSQHFCIWIFWFSFSFFVFLLLLKELGVRKASKWNDFIAWNVQLLVFCCCWIWKLICQEKHEWEFVTSRLLHKYSQLWHHSN